MCERQLERRVGNRQGARSSHNNVRVSPPVANSNTFSSSLSALKQKSRVDLFIFLF